MMDKTQHYMHKVQDLPPEVVIKKAFRKIKNKGLDTISRISAKVFDTGITDEEFLRKIWGLEYKFQNLRGLQEYFREREEPKFFINSSTWQEILSIIYKHFPNAPKKIVAEADKVCEHIFDLLGSCQTKLPGSESVFKIKNSKFKTQNYILIDWHVDFKTGYRWNPKKYYKDIEIPYAKADIKVPWELSRLQHLATLGQAYWISKNKKYVQEFINQITDWIENNPPKFGVNWVSTMDVAIRAVNWIFGFYFFAGANEIPDEFCMRFLKSLFLHGRFIRGNLEIGYDDQDKKITSNHYLSDIVGLIFLGLFFKDTKEGKEWLELGVKELISEMEFQVYPDGADFESSIPYHRLISELFSISAILCKINGIELPQKFWERLKKMLDFIMYYTKPDGKAPQIGDNDNGRLWILSNYGNWDVKDHRYLLSIGAVLFNRPNLKQAAGKFYEEAFWLLGKKGLEVFNSINQTNAKNSTNLKSKAFPDSGYYIMRNKDNYMIISAGEVGTKGIGNHKHNDVLSFELFAHGKSFIIDPGTYIYSADPGARNLFRSTAYHNTIQVDEKEINRFNKDALFQMKEDAYPKVNHWEITDNYDFFDAEHIGYERLTQPVKHRRQIYFDKLEGLWIIKDVLTGVGKHKFDQYFHFAPMDVTINPEDSLVVTTNGPDGTNIIIIPAKTHGLEISIENGWISHSYGIKIEAPIVRYSKTTDVPTSFTVFLYPYENQCRYSVVEIKQFFLKIDLELKEKWA